MVTRIDDVMRPLTGHAAAYQDRKTSQIVARFARSTLLVDSARLTSQVHTFFSRRSFKALLMAVLLLAALRSSQA